MKRIIEALMGLIITCSSALAAVGEEGAASVPEPTVSVGWVWFFFAVFVGICVWFGYAIWHADKKSRNEAKMTGPGES
jgi:hypothetical protein